MGGSSVPRISAPWIFIRVIPISSHDLFKRPHKIQVHPHLHFAIPKGCTPISTRERERERGSKKARMNPDEVSRAFVEHYYSTFDSNRAALASLYQEGSMLTFEGQKIQGSPNIVAKLTSLPFQQCKHAITTVDCQPSGPAGGMLVFVSGNLQLAGEQHALKFSQVFLQTPSHHTHAHTYPHILLAMDCPLLPGHLSA
jgi:hypothetical protein